MVVLAVAVGFAFAYGVWAAEAGGVIPVLADANYRLIRLDEVNVVRQLHAGLALAAGLFIFPALTALVVPGRAGASPLLTTLGMLAGSALGFYFATGPLHQWPWPGPAPEVAPGAFTVAWPVAWLPAVLGAFVGGKLVTRPRRGAVPGLVRRVAEIALGYAAVGAAVWYTWPAAPGFPGATASPEVRHAWAVEAFGWRFHETERRLRECGDVTARMGTVFQVAPVVGTNQVLVGAKQTTGTMTLEVLAQRGRAVARVNVRARPPVTDRDRFEVDGTLDSPTGTVPLLCP